MALKSHLEFTMIAADNSARVTAHLAPLGKGTMRSGPVLVFLEDASLHERARATVEARVARAA